MKIQGVFVLAAAAMPMAAAFAPSVRVQVAVRQLGIRSDSRPERRVDRFVKCSMRLTYCGASSSLTVDKAYVFAFYCPFP
jgi:hypothetical protein